MLPKHVQCAGQNNARTPTLILVVATSTTTQMHVAQKAVCVMAVGLFMLLRPRRKLSFKVIVSVGVN